MSLTAPAASEMFAAWFKRRAWMLWKGVRNLLDDEKLANELYSHPLIRSLAAAVPPFGRPIDAASARRIQFSLDFEF